MPRVAPQAITPRTGAADLSAAAQALLGTLGRARDVLVSDSDRTAANRLVLLGYARRISDAGQPLRIRITATGREKLGAQRGPGPDKTIAPTVQDHAAGPMPPAPEDFLPYGSIVKDNTGCDV